MPHDFTRRWRDARYVANYLQFTAPVSPNRREWSTRLRVDPASTVLDLGCGEAKVLAAISPGIEFGIGVDASPHMVQAGRRHATDRRAGNVSLVQADFRRLPIPSESIDAALSNAALHHVPDDGKLQCLKELARVLRPGSLFYLRDDAFNFDPRELKGLQPQIYDEFEREFGVSGWAFLRDHLAGTDFECTPYTSDLLALLEATGFKIRESTPTGLDGVEILAVRSAA
jgi:SAM-dependent methyltransferase